MRSKKRARWAEASPATAEPSQAAAGRGEDAAQLDDQERSRLRWQALEWLKADLAAYDKRLENGSPAARAFVQHRLQQWRGDIALVGIRESEALAKLPPDEQK